LSIIKSIFTNSAGIATSRILGFIRDMTTASILGANIYSDIFFIAFKIPNLFRTIFAEGAFAQSFIPNFVASKQKALFSIGIFYRIMGIIILLTIGVFIFDFFVAMIFGMGYDEATQKISAPLIAINFLYLDAIFVVSFLGALLQYRKHFATTAFSTSLLNISMIIALVIAKDFDKLTIVYYLSYGVVIGGILQILIHLFSIRRERLDKMLIIGIKSYPKKHSKIKDEKKRFTKDFIPSIFGSSTAQISAFIDTTLGTFLTAGSISYLYYANRILQLPLAIFAIAVSTALFPTVARAIKNNREDEAIELLKKSFWILIFLLSMASVGGIILSFDIMKLLFERGAFGREDTLNSAFVLSMYMIGLVPFGLAKIFNLWLYSYHKQNIAAKISAISLGFNIILSLILFYPLGAGGLALSGSIAGFILLYLTVKEFGFDKFSLIIKDKRILWLISAIFLEIIILLIFKSFKISL
jgi:putative peptidoglycan lipid II flippase